jgi:putative membrane protein
MAALARLARLDHGSSKAAADRAAGDDGRARGDGPDRGALRRAGRAPVGPRPAGRAAGRAFDADALFDLVEAEVLAPLDAAARLEVEAAARQVATGHRAGALALADVAAALTANLRMIRRIAEIYGGRPARWRAGG